MGLFVSARTMEGCMPSRWVRVHPYGVLMPDARAGRFAHHRQLLMGLSMLDQTMVNCMPLTLLVAGCSGLLLLENPFAHRQRSLMERSTSAHRTANSMP